MDRRASAPAAVGLMGLVATVVAAAVVLLAPSASPGADAPTTGVETEVPTSFPDGTDLPPVPDELTAAVDEPVVVADRRDELPEGVHCETGARWEGEPEIEAVFVTPTSLRATLVGEATFPEEAGGRSEVMRANCSATRDRGRWRESGSSMSSEHRPGPPGTTDGSGFSCCEDGHGTANADVSVADDDLAWLLQDRGPYWLAYPVGGLDSVSIDWPIPRPRGEMVDAPPVRVLLLDGGGAVVADQMVGQ